MQPTSPESGDQVAELLGDFRLRGPNLEELLELKDREINRLKARLDNLEAEKQEMLESFQTTSGLMIERLKTLEAQLAGSSERPMTANVLGRLGEGHAPPIPLSSSEWGGATISSGNSTPPRKIQEIDPYALRDAPLVAGRRWASSKIPENDLEELKEQRVAQARAVAMSYRNATKCKICGELLLSSDKKAHLASYRSEDKLRQAISGLGDLKVLDLMLNHDFDINSKLKGGNMAMHLAVQEGTQDTMLALVARECKVDEPNQQGSTPLMLACELGKHPMVKALVELGASLGVKDKNLRTPLMIACKNGDLDLCKYLVQQEVVDIHAINAIGDNSLGIAQRSGNQQIVMLLLQHGASLRKKKLF